MGDFNTEAAEYSRTSIAVVKFNDDEPSSVGHIGMSQPSLIQPPTEINPSPEISDKDKVTVLAKPDPELYNAKRKAATLAVSETESSAFDLKKKLKKEWSCSLCEIKATSESGLNAHLNGKKHKIKEARQNKMIWKSNKKSGKLWMQKATKNEEQLIETVADNDINVPKSENGELLEEKSNKDSATEETGKDKFINQRMLNSC